MRNCSLCKQLKPLSKFRQFKSGKKKGSYTSHCNDCLKLPWYKTYKRILDRVRYRICPRYNKLKCLITPEELKKLWFRDKGWLLKYPSINRKNPKGDYIYKNCEYIEFSENARRGRIGVIQPRNPNGTYKCLTTNSTE